MSDTHAERQLEEKLVEGWLLEATYAASQGGAARELAGLHATTTDPRATSASRPRVTTSS